MCGISGWIDWDRNLMKERSAMETMSETLSPRGPDESGFWFSKEAAFAHRRLVVIDPAGGKQPMTRKRGRQSFTLVYNGELYNTDDIRQELCSRGYRFQGHSDTEVLLVSYMEWGPASVKHLNGIYAFAVWEEHNRRLFMARDRLGVKPLFYKLLPHGLVFASELKTLLAHEGVRSEIDGEGLAEIMVLGPSRTPGHGIFRGVKELKPANYLIFDSSGLRQHRYWSLISEPHRENLTETAEHLHYLLKDALERQLVSDVPVCTLLSGGLDSSALSALAANYYTKHGKGPLHTYSIDYAGNDKYFKSSAFQPNSDTRWVPLMSDFLGSIHHYIQVDTPELAAALDNAVTARDLPGMADVDSSLYLFCREIKKQATVALSGECADEIFGGYPWFYRQEALNSSTFPWMREQRLRLSFLSETLLQKVGAEEYLDMRYREALAEVPLLGGESDEQSKMRQMQYLTLTRWMPILLDRKDRMSMACGLEIRVPFCDHRLVEYAWNIPWQLKNAGGREKGILRSSLKGILPEEVLYRKKSPYPKTYNPSYLAAVSSRMQQILTDKHSPLQPLINKKAVQALMSSSGAEMNLPWFGQLMSGPQMLAYLIQTDYWLRQYQVNIAL